MRVITRRWYLDNPDDTGYKTKPKNKISGDEIDLLALLENTMAKTVEDSTFIRYEAVNNGIADWQGRLKNILVEVFITDSEIMSIDITISDSNDAGDHDSNTISIEDLCAQNAYGIVWGCLSAINGEDENEVK